MVDRSFNVAWILQVYCEKNGEFYTSWKGLAVLFRQDKKWKVLPAGLQLDRECVCIWNGQMLLQRLQTGAVDIAKMQDRLSNMKEQKKQLKMLHMRSIITLSTSVDR